MVSIVSTRVAKGAGPATRPPPILHRRSAAASTGGASSASSTAGDWAPERIRRGDGREWNLAAVIDYWERQGWYSHEGDDVQ